MFDFVTLGIGAFFALLALLNFYWYKKGYGGPIFPINLLQKSPSVGLRRELLIRTVIISIIAVLVLGSAFKS